MISSILSRLGTKAALIGAAVLAVLLILLRSSRLSEKAGRLAERVDNLNRTLEVKNAQVNAAAHRPRNRDHLARRMRDGSF